MAGRKKAGSLREQLVEIEGRIEQNRAEYARLKKRRAKLVLLVQKEEEAEILAEISKSGLSKEDIIKLIQG